MGLWLILKTRTRTLRHSPWQSRVANRHWARRFGLGSRLGLCLLPLAVCSTCRGVIRRLRPRFPHYDIELSSSSLRGWVVFGQWQHCEYLSYRRAYCWRTPCIGGSKSTCTCPYSRAACPPLLTWCFSSSASLEASFWGLPPSPRWPSPNSFVDYSGLQVSCGAVFAIVLRRRFSWLEWIPWCSCRKDRRDTAASGWDACQLFRSSLYFLDRRTIS